jgi:hypothetical protein
MKTYRDVRTLTDITSWRVNFTKHDVIALNTQKVIIREIILKKRSFYYEFDELLKDSLITQSFFVSKFTKSDVDLLDSSMKDTKMNLSDENKEKDKKRDKNVEEKNKDNEDKNWATNNTDTEDVLFDISTNTIVKEKFSKKTRINLNKRVKRVIKIKKITFKRILFLDSNSDDIVSRSFKRESRARSIADALIEMQNMKFRDFSKQFEYETRHRDQHHKEIVLKQKEAISINKMQHEKKIMRLKIELKKTSQKK